MSDKYEYTMTLLGAILVLIPYRSIVVSQHVTLNEMTWKEALSSCELATPAIYYKDNTFKVDINERSGTWLGYSQISIALLYVGCTEASTLQNIKNVTIVKKDLSLCYSFCKTHYIGVSPKRSCYCMDTLPSNSTTICTDPCESPTGTLCGDLDRGAHTYRVSLYEKVTYPIENYEPMNEPSAPCRALEPNEKKFFWKQCSTNCSLVCLSDNKSTFYNVKTSKPWNERMRRCLSMRNIPVSEQYNLNIPQKTSCFWTGIIQVLAILSVEEINTDDTSYKAGYALRKGGEPMTLQFEDVNSGSKRKALCQQGGGTTSGLEKISWVEANSSTLCELETPKIDFHEDILTTQYAGHGNGMWVGYVQVSIALLYKGCAESSSIQNASEYNNVTYNDVTRDPGMCYSMCKTTYVGISKERTCYCIKEIPENRTLGCTGECDSPKNVLCGDTTDASRVSLYKKHDNTVTGNKVMNDENIFCKSCKGTTQYPRPCSKGLGTACSKGGNVYTGDSGSWDKSMEDCLKNGSDPVSVCSTHEKEVWTGVIQVNGIISAKEFDKEFDKRVSLFQAGYIKQVGDSGKFQLLFDDAENGTRIPLCKKGNRSETTTQQEFTPTSENHTVSTTASTTQSNASDEYAYKSEKQEQDLTIVIVAVAIAFVTIVIGVTIAVLCLRRKRSKEQNASLKPPERKDKGKGNEYSSNAGGDVQRIGSAYELSEYSECTYAKPGTSSGGKDGEETYDTTNIKHPVQNTSDNIYNSLQDSPYGQFKPSTKQVAASDDTYSHAILTDTDNDDTYNHVTKKVAKSDDTYSHVTQKGVQNDDTYSHVTQKGVQNDDTYSHVTQKSVQNDDTYNHVTQEGVQNDDTYSHVGQKGGAK